MLQRAKVFTSNTTTPCDPTNVVLVIQTVRGLSACCMAALAYNVVASATDASAVSRIRHRACLWGLLCLLHTHPKRHWCHIGCQAQQHDVT